MGSKNYPAGRALPPGGAPGDVLTKASTDDQDVEWAAGGSGGGVNVDNGTDPPAAVSTLVAPGAVFNGDTATVRSVYTSEADPGAVGAGNLWLNPDYFGDNTNFALLSIRDEADISWTAISPVAQVTDTDALIIGSVTAQATATGTSAVLAVQDDLGAVGFRTNAHSNGTTTTSIYARGLGQDGITMRADDESAILRVAPEGRLGFFGKAFDPALQPSAPTTLTHVIDALKALGLVAS